MFGPGTAAPRLRRRGEPVPACRAAALPRRPRDGWHRGVARRAAGRRGLARSGASTARAAWSVSRSSGWPGRSSLDLLLIADISEGVPRVAGRRLGSNGRSRSLWSSRRIAVIVAVLRYRLYDLGRVVSRTVSYAVLSALLLGVYLAMVTGPGVSRSRTAPPSPWPPPPWPRPPCSSRFASASRRSSTTGSTEPLRRGSHRGGVHPTAARAGRPRRRARRAAHRRTATRCSRPPQTCGCARSSR